MSKKFFISYDLLGQNRSQDYQRIENVLINNKADRVLINLWVYEGNLYDSSLAVRNELLPLLRRDDRLLVIEAIEWAWYIGQSL